MPAEPDVFKKLDALLNKHKNGESAASSDGGHDEDAIPTLTDAVEDDETFPVLTEIIVEDVDDMSVEGLELDLEFIPEDTPAIMSEPLLSADLPDIWERNEQEFDAETTHGFGLSAFSREASDSIIILPDEADDHDSSDAHPQLPEIEEFPSALQPDSTPDQAQFGAAGDGDTPHMFVATDEKSDADSARPAMDGPHISEQRTAEAAPSPSPAQSDAEDARIEALARELTFTDALAERALRDLDRHVATILEHQVGPQLAHRLDQALASMLAQFSTNIESLIREAVREEMRRYFDGDSQ